MHTSSSIHTHCGVKCTPGIQYTRNPVHQESSTRGIHQSTFWWTRDVRGILGRLFSSIHICRAVNKKTNTFVNSHIQWCEQNKQTPPPPHNHHDIPLPVCSRPPTQNANCKTTPSPHNHHHIPLPVCSRPPTKNANCKTAPPPHNHHHIPPPVCSQPPTQKTHCTKPAPHSHNHHHIPPPVCSQPPTQNASCQHVDRDSATI